MDGSPMWAGISFVFLGVIGSVIEAAIYRLGLDIMSGGPFVGAVQLLTGLPELSIVAGVALIIQNPNLGKS